MAILPDLYRLVSKLFKYDSMKNVKDALRPAKHFLLGKDGVYRVIELVEELEKRNGRKVSMVFDVGAAVGDMSLAFLRHFEEAEVHCFEPLPQSFERLKARTESFSPRAHLHNLALSNQDGEGELYVTPYHDSSSILKPKSSLNRIPIKLQRLDTISKQEGIKRIDLLKIDVEGFEKEVLEGGEKTLEITDNVFVEILPRERGAERSHTHIDVFEALYKAGFSFAGVYGDFFFSKLI